MLARRCHAVGLGLVYAVLSSSTGLYRLRYLAAIRLHGMPGRPW